MNSFSVVVTTCDNGAVLPNAPQSVEAAIAFLRRDDGAARGAPAKVVVDDGSTDDTADVLGAVTRGKDLYLKVVRRPRPTSPACARNVGVAASRGELQSFLDAATCPCRATCTTACGSWPTRR